MNSTITIDQLAIELGVHQENQDTSKVNDWHLVFYKLNETLLPPQSSFDDNFPKSRRITILFNNREYIFTKPIVLYKNVHLLGCGGYGDGSGSTLKINYNDKPGIVCIKDIEQYYSPYSIIEKLNIIGMETVYSKNTVVYNHGILAYAPVNVTDCFISGFGGDGIHIEGATHNGRVADLWKIYNTTIQHCRNGLFIHGSDAHVGIATLLNTISNRKYGICDCGQLGNTFISCHSSYNGYDTIDGGGIKNMQLVPTPLLVPEIKKGLTQADIINHILIEDNIKKIVFNEELTKEVLINALNTLTSPTKDGKIIKFKLELKLICDSNLLNLNTDFIKSFALYFKDEELYIDPLGQIFYNNAGKQIVKYPVSLYTIYDIKPDAVNNRNIPNGTFVTQDALIAEIKSKIAIIPDGNLIYSALLNSLDSLDDKSYKIPIDFISDTLNLSTEYSKYVNIVCSNNIMIDSLGNLLYTNDDKEIKYTTVSTKNGSSIFIGCYTENVDQKDSKINHNDLTHSLIIGGTGINRNKRKISIGSEKYNTSDPQNYEAGLIDTGGSGAAINMYNGVQFLNAKTNWESADNVKIEKIFDKGKEIDKYVKDDGIIKVCSKGDFDTIKNNHSRFIVSLADGSKFYFERKKVTSIQNLNFITGGNDHNMLQFQSILRKYILEREYEMINDEVAPNHSNEIIIADIADGVISDYPYGNGFEKVSSFYQKQKNDLYFRFNDRYNTWDYSFDSTASHVYSGSLRFISKYLTTNIIDTNSEKIKLDNEAMWFQYGIYIGRDTGDSAGGNNIIKLDLIEDINSLPVEKKYLIGEIRFNKNPIKDDPKQGYAGWIYASDNKWYPFGWLGEAANTTNNNGGNTGGASTSIKEFIKEHLPVSVSKIIFGLVNDSPGVIIGPNGIPVPIDPEWGKSNNITFFISHINSILTFADMYSAIFGKKELLKIEPSKIDSIVKEKIISALKMLTSKP